MLFLCETWKAEKDEDDCAKPLLLIMSTLETEDVIQMLTGDSGIIESTIQDRIIPNPPVFAKRLNLRIKFGAILALLSIKTV